MAQVNDTGNDNEKYDAGKNGTIKMARKNDTCKNGKRTKITQENMPKIKLSR